MALSSAVGGNGGWVGLSVSDIVRKYDKARRERKRATKQPQHAHAMLGNAGPYTYTQTQRHATEGSYSEDGASRSVRDLISMLDGPAGGHSVVVAETLEEPSRTRRQEQRTSKTQREKRLE